MAFLLLVHYFTLWPWPLIFDLEHLQCIACNVMNLGTKFERSQAVHGGVIAISVFDLMTLNIALRVALGSVIIFLPSLTFDNSFVPELSRFLMLILYVTLWLWPDDLQVHGTSIKTLDVIRLYEMSAKSSNHGWIIHNFVNFCTRYVTLAVALTFDLLILNFTTLRVSCV